MDWPMLADERLRLRLEFEDLLYREAALLDEGRWDEWLALLDDEVRYFAPLRANVHAEADHFAERWRLALFDDNRAGIEARIARLTSGAAHTDDPPSRVRHFVANVRVLDREGPTVRVASNFLVFRNRRERDQNLFCGTREDAWRRDGTHWRLSRRDIRLDHHVIDNVTVFF
jgi:3-phenylpropionate/cinnamic acid dioxygenase small subunit